MSTIKTMVRVRGGSGLGDSLYVRPVADHFIRSGCDVVALTDYPDVFVGSGIKTEPHRKTGFDVLAHYTSGKDNPRTTQWQDVCASAEIGDAPMRFKWQVRNWKLVEWVTTKANGRPVVLVNGGRHPMGRVDGFAREMLPEKRAFDTVLNKLKKSCLIVEIGKGQELYPVLAEIDLCDRTSVSDLLDLATVSDALVGQCSFMIPLAECFDKPFLGVWAARGLASNILYIRQCVPEKILSKPSSTFVMDDWRAERIEGVADAFYRV